MKGEEGKKKLGIWCVEVRHGRATTGTGRAKLLDICGLEGMVRHGRATTGTGRAKVLAVLAQNFFLRFLESCSNNYLQNNLKQTKNKQKAIKCVGCLPRSARLKSLA